jgi:hypothetical protein
MEAHADRLQTLMGSEYKMANEGPSFSAPLVCAQIHELSAASLIGAIQRLYPQARIAGWGGSGQAAQGNRGIFLSINGVDIGIVHQQFVAPLLAFDGGNQPNFYWQSAIHDIATHKSHLFVVEAAFGEFSRSVERASAVTIVIDAISNVVPLMGVMWETARNLVQADHFAKLMQPFRTSGVIPAGLWIRLLAAYQPSAQNGVAGTFGLKYFGSPDIEIHARRLGYAESLSTALSYAQSRLTTGRPTWHETTTTVEDVATFDIDLLDDGLFGIGRVAKLTEIASSGADAPQPLPSAQRFTTAEDRVAAPNVSYGQLMGQVVRGIRNAFYAKPKETWDMARIESTRQLDGFFAQYKMPSPPPG